MDGWMNASRRAQNGGGGRLCWCLNGRGKFVLVLGWEDVYWCLGLGTVRES